MNLTQTACVHLDMIKDVVPLSEGCLDCLDQGDDWVHLRMCLSCGHIGCCDSSKNQHANNHFQQFSHPIIKSFQPGENWLWCYVDQINV